MGKESSVWKWLSTCRNEFRHDLHMNRVENSCIKGMPDVEGFLYDSIKGSGVQFWIELKSASRPVKPESNVVLKIRPEQVEWAKRRCAIGGLSWFLIAVGNGYGRSTYLVWGKDGAELQKGVNEEQLKNLSVLKLGSKARDIIERAAEIL